MVIGECLERATMIDGRRRFYAPGRHPATYRERAMVEMLFRLWSIHHPGDETLPEQIAWHQKRVDDFERGQCLEKARYIEAHELFDADECVNEAIVRLVERLRQEARPERESGIF